MSVLQFSHNCHIFLWAYWQWFINCDVFLANGHSFDRTGQVFKVWMEFNLDVDIYNMCSDFCK